MGWELCNPSCLAARTVGDSGDRGARSRLSRRALRVPFATLILAGVMTQGVGVARLRQVRITSDALSCSWFRPPLAVVITDPWFVVQIALAVYGQVPFLVVLAADDWHELDG